MEKLPRGRALITGSEGFTGFYMAAELAAAGYEVYGLGTQPSTNPNYYQTDLTDRLSLQKVIQQIAPEVVIHLAALAYVASDDPTAFYRVNLIGTRNLLEALNSLTQTPRHILLTSSANVYGNTRQGKLDESIPPNPANDYAVSKLAMEYMAKLWLDKLPITIARPFNYTGVGQKAFFLIPKIVAHFKQRAKMIELGNLDVWRDFGDVRAVVYAYRRLLETKAMGKIVNVCTGLSYSLRDVVTLCEEICQHSLEIKVNPMFVRDNEVKSLYGDATQLRTLIGDWQPPALVDTLRWMIESH